MSYQNQQQQEGSDFIQELSGMGIMKNVFTRIMPGIAAVIWAGLFVMGAVGLLIFDVGVSGFSISAMTRQSALIQFGMNPVIAKSLSWLLSFSISSVLTYLWANVDKSNFSFNKTPWLWVRKNFTRIIAYLVAVGDTYLGTGIVAVWVLGVSPLEFDLFHVKLPSMALVLMLIVSGLDLMAEQLAFRMILSFKRMAMNGSSFRAAKPQQSQQKKQPRRSYKRNQKTNNQTQMKLGGLYGSKK